MKFLRHGRAPHDAAPFEHRHFETGRRQIRRTDEPVVTAADHHDIPRRRINHDSSLPWAGAFLAQRRFGAASVLPARGAAERRVNAPWHSALTQSSHSAIASRGLNRVGLRLNSTQNPSSSADSAIAAGRGRNGGAAPESTSWPNRDSRTARYLP